METETETGRNIKARNTEQTPSLPPELIKEILLKLPIESIVRFKLVSKSWRNMMSDKRFIESHLQNSSKNPKVLMITKEHSSSKPEASQISLLSLLNNVALDPPQQINTNCLESNICLKSIFIVGCCNGLVCILLNDKHFILWNPSTRSSKLVPPVDDEFCYNCCGFGHNKQSDDYVVLFHFCYLNEDACKLYSLKNDSCKTIDSDFTLVLPHMRGVLVGGKFHWIKFMKKLGIMAFDFNTETFETFDQPLDNPSGMIPNLGTLGDRLSVLYANECRIEVWVMNEYGVRDSWAKVMTVDNAGCGQCFGLFCICGGEGEIMLFKNRELSIYRRIRGGSGYERVRVLENHWYREALVYSESLVSLSP